MAERYLSVAGALTQGTLTDWPGFLNFWLDFVTLVRMAEITKKSIEHLAELSRLELSEKEKEKFLADLTGILNHFKELEAVDVSGVTAMTGGTNLQNITRVDEPLPETFDNQKGIIAGFPEEERGYNKIPPVF